MNLPQWTILIARIDGPNWFWSSPIPSSVLLLLSLATLVLIAWSLNSAVRTNSRFRAVFILYAVRLLCLLSIVVALAGPIGLAPTADRLEQERLELLIVVDDSTSMATRDVTFGALGTLITRFEALKQRWLDNSTIDALRDRVDLRFLRLGEDLVPTSLNALNQLNGPGSDATRLVGHMESMLRSPDLGNDLAGILLLSDGRDTQEASIERLTSTANNSSARVFAVPFGRETAQPDLAVRMLAERSEVFIGEATRLHVDVQGFGYAGQSTRAVLYENDEPIAERRIKLTSHSSRLVFEIEPSDAAPPGGSGKQRSNGSQLVEYRLNIEPMPDESNTANNTRHAFVQVIRNRVRVLLLENEPYWDSRFFVRTLRRNPRIELTTITGVTERTEHVRRYDPAFSTIEDEEGINPFGAGVGSAVEIRVPDSADAFSYYDVVVLGKGTGRWITESRAHSLTDFVTERGGNLIFLRGIPMDIKSEAGRQALSIVESIAPVRWGITDVETQTSGGDLALTPEGRRLEPIDFSALGDTDLVMTELPGMIALTRIEGERSLSSVWLRRNTPGDENVLEVDTSEEPAAVAHMRAGRGQTLAVLAHGLWKWALVPDQQRELDQAYDLFWTRTIHWLVGDAEFLPGQSVSLEVEPLAVQPGHDVSIVVSTRFIDIDSFAGTLKVTDPIGESHSLLLREAQRAPGQFLATFTAESEGVHEVRLDMPVRNPPSIETRFAVYDDRRERLNTAADHTLMKRLAEITGGETIPFDQPEALLDHLESEKQARSLPAFERRLAWHSPLFLIVLLLALGAEWFVRRRLRLR